jgi:integrase
MNPRYRSYRRNGGVFYVFDRLTGKRESLNTSNLREAERLIQAKNDSHERPAFNLQLARMYLTASDPESASRTWADVLQAIFDTKSGPTRERWENAAKQKALAPLLRRRLIDTRAEHLLAVLKAGTISTNVFLRRTHNFALDMGWLTAPILNRRQWPKTRFKPKRAITREEHERILTAEKNPEWNAYYHFCWHLGASQSDVAALRAENIDWQTRSIAYRRRKTGVPVVLRFGDELAELIRARLPATGPFFPRLIQLHEKHRAKLFNRRCRLLGIKGVSLHSYRYAWAERAMTCGYPERFAQAALGHNCSAVHRAYARNARLTIPPLDEYERPPSRRITHELGLAAIPAPQP